MSKRVGVVMCGCGSRDGSEIHEATLTLLSLARAGVEAIVFAPDREQPSVVNHLTGKTQEGSSSRNMMIESARIARGKVTPLSSAQADSLDALIFPGGMGAALNLCTFLKDGVTATVLPEVKSIIESMYRSKKPIGAICIAPSILALVLGKNGILLTAGDDLDTAAKYESLGARHQVCTPTEIVVDRTHKIVTTPAYMNGRSIGELEQGIDKLVKGVLALC